MKYLKQYWNESKSKSIIITRLLLSDGYNYYITVLNVGFNGALFIDESFKQDEILSEKKAIETAKNTLK